MHPLSLWSVTSAPASGTSGASILFGPLRFRQWTSAPVEAGTPGASIPIGALRFLQWTSDDAVVLVPGVQTGAVHAPRAQPLEQRPRLAATARPASTREQRGTSTSDTRPRARGQRRPRSR